MRVAYFTESLYPHVDGVSRTLARLFATLENDGIDFRIYAPFTPSGELSWSARVRHTPYIHFPPYPDYRVSLPFTREIRRDLVSFSPDLVHLVSPTPLAYRAQSLAQHLDIPTVASFHTHFVSYFRYYGIGKLETLGWAYLRRFYRRCARVYAPTVSIATELTEQGISGVEIWSRGIDLSNFSPSRADPRLTEIIGEDASAPILLLVSRLVKEKDLSDLVAMDRTLRQRGVAFRFVLVGDGPLRDTLQSALPHAHFAGHREGLDLARWYASADIFVFPSTTETLGNVVLEALASGLPAVVVNRGGPQDLVQHGINGFIAHANDPDDLATQVQRLLEDPELRASMSSNACASAVSHDWEEINGGLLASYAAVIAEHGIGRRA